MAVTVTFNEPGHIEDMLSEVSSTVTTHRTDRTIYTSEHRLVGKTAEWLKNHGHGGVITRIHTSFTDGLPTTQYQITFKDSKLATLFKLTWL